MSNKIKSKQIDLENLSTDLDLANKYADKNQTQSDINELRNILNLQSTRNYFIITDIVNGYEYIIQMYDGNLISFSKCTGIEVTKLPTRVEYPDGQAFEPEGMVVIATCEDGTTREITNFTHDVYVSNDEHIISYTELGNTFTAIADIIVNDFDPAVVLIDFNYTDNGDGTYSITSWKGTLNGETSDIMVVPNNKHVIYE